MQTKTSDKAKKATVQLLLKLGIPPHRVGYAQLCVAIPYFAKNKQQCLATDLYPYVAAELGYPDWHAVEHSIRDLITDTWEERDPEVWAEYFPNCKEAPSNKRFIATLAEYI